MKIMLLGAGGHAKVIASSVRRLGWELVGFLDDGKPAGTAWGGSSILGSLPSFLDYPPEIAAVVSIGVNWRRRQVYEWLVQSGRKIVSVIDPHAVVDESVRIGKGTVIMPGVVVNADSVIGENCILNTSCSVDHDCAIWDHAHLSPGVHLAGGVWVGVASMVGTGANVLPLIRIGSGCQIGAGSVVLSDIPDDATAYGVPCRSKKKGY